jgi:glycosyltransferase involved in cell wall biosynthesis
MSDGGCVGHSDVDDLTSAMAATRRSSRPRLLCVGGEDHELRIPFMLHLRDHGFQVTAVGTGDPVPFSRAGIEYRAFRFDRFANPVADWDAVGALRGLFLSLRPALIQSFDTKPNLLVPLASRSYRDAQVIRTINGLGWLYSSHTPLAVALRPFYCSLHRVAAHSTAATVFQNRTDQAFFEQRRMVGTGLSRMIPGSGIDIERFARSRASGPSPQQLREELGLVNCEVVITVTRLTRLKGISTLLQAASLVHQIRPGVRFLLVGPRQSEGPFAISQSEIDRHAPYVVATGRRSDVPALLGIADVFAFPTEYREGIPRVLLEAALAGLPIVTTSMPGCSDVIKDGWSGSIVPPRAPQALAARIVGLLCDRPNALAMGARAAKLVTEEFGLELTAARYAVLYAGLLDRTNRVIASGATSGGSFAAQSDQGAGRPISSIEWSETTYGGS